MIKYEWFFTGSGRIELRLARGDARQGSHPGPCDTDIAALRLKPYIARQLSTLPHAVLAEELREYGAWDDAELADHDANLSRILWIACGDIEEQGAGQ